MTGEIRAQDTDRLIAELCRNRPALQVDGNQGLVDLNRRPPRIVLRRNVTPGQRTIETGSGMSTILFLLLGADHTAVSPDAGEPERIRRYCETRGIFDGTFLPTSRAI